MESFHTLECKGSCLASASREEGRDTAESERDSREKWDCPMMEGGQDEFPGAFSGASLALVEPREHRMQAENSYLGLPYSYWLHLSRDGLPSSCHGCKCMENTVTTLSPTHANKCNFLLCFQGERVGC